MNYNFTASIAIPDLNGYDLLDAREKLDFEKSIGMYKDNNADAQINKDKDYNYKLSLVESGVNTYWLAQSIAYSLKVGIKRLDMVLILSMIKTMG